MSFTPVPNYCEENVWQLLRQPSSNPRWAVFVTAAEGQLTMWAQISQFGLHPVVWDYHVVLLEQGPDGYTIWDSNFTKGHLLACSDWTQSNFPQPDPNVRFRVVESEEFLKGFRSDRRHMRNDLGELESPPPWPEISQGESNLSTYISTHADLPGVVLDLAGWLKMTVTDDPIAISYPDLSA